MTDKEIEIMKLENQVLRNAGDKLYREMSRTFETCEVFIDSYPAETALADYAREIAALDNAKRPHIG